MTLGQVLDKFISNRDKALKRNYIDKPIAWALYETWKWADAYEKNRNEDKELAHE